jgi:4-hydroxybenzoate polyprenyltransferase
MIKKIKNIFLSELVHGGHLQCLSALSIVYLASVFLGTPLGFDALAVVYLMFYPIYLFDRARGVREDYLTNRKRTAHIKSYLKFVPAIILFDILILTAIFCFYGTAGSLILALMIIAVGFAYQSYFKKLTSRIWLFKNFFVAVFFSFVIVFYLFYYGIDMTVLVPTLYIVAGFFFLKILSIQIFFDLKDIPDDKKRGLLTLPVLVGRRKTIVFLEVFNVLLMAAGLIFVFLEVLPPVFIALAPTLLFTFVYLEKAKKEIRLPYILSASELVLWALLLIFINFVL